MTKRGKLEKFEVVRELDNVLQANTKEFGLLHWYGDTNIRPKGKWHELFGNDNPITLECACGKGEYTIGLARMYPNRNFIGVDVKGARIWRGATTAHEEKLTNVRFVRSKIELLRYVFDKDEVDEIWITFADPFLKGKKKNRRLTSPHFLNTYRQFVKDNGLVHLKTDSHVLYYYTISTLGAENIPVILQNNDIYREPKLPPELEIKTFYEKQHLQNNRQIKYLRFAL